MERISKRDLCHSISKYLKDGKFIVTNRGKDEYVITIEKVDGNKTIDSGTSDTSEHIEAVGGCETECGEVMGSDAYYAEKAHRMAYYGCGCGRIPGSSLCPKHGRM